MPELDIEKVRNETPACEQIIHFNNAGASLAPAAVTTAVIEHLQLEQKIGGYEAARLASDGLSSFYSNLAKLLNCQPAEIAFVENATRAWDMALYAIDWRPGDKILTFQNEYASNYLALLHLARQQAIELEVIPTDSQGLIDLDALAQAMDKRVKLICLTHVASQHGMIQPAQQVGKIARQHGVLFLLDACQSAGQIALDSQELACDFLCGSGRKYLRGPRGTGFLYVSKNSLKDLNPIFIDLHAARWLNENSYELRQDACRFENWERYVAGQIGLSIAVDYASKLGLGNIASRVSALAIELISSLNDMVNVTVHERGAAIHERGDQLSGIVTFSKANESATELQQRLADSGINISVSKTANARMDFERRGLNDVARASVHYYNTVTEIEHFIEVLSQK